MRTRTLAVRGSGRFNAPMSEISSSAYAAFERSASAPFVLKTTPNWTASNCLNFTADPVSESVGESKRFESAHIFTVFLICVVAFMCAILSAPEF